MVYIHSIGHLKKMPQDRHYLKQCGPGTRALKSDVHRVRIRIAANFTLILG